MLKLTLKPTECITIGKNIRVVYTGGSKENIVLLVDAPREIRISRSIDINRGDKSPYHREEISEEAHNEINRILKRERAKKKHELNDF